MLPQTKTFAKQAVLTLSRRTDVVANKSVLYAFLDGLRSGTYQPVHGMMPGVPCNLMHLSPEQHPVLDWFSKDFTNLIAAWPDYPELDRYAHHFSVTINGPCHSFLEPGLESTLITRYEMLDWLVQKAKSLGQDLYHSILVHLDPMIAYDVDGLGYQHNLGHAPLLIARMAANHLFRIHVSVYQDFRKSEANLRRLHINAYAPRAEDIERYVILPAALHNIRIETCSSLTELKALFPGSVHKGACLGEADVLSLTHGQMPIGLVDSNSGAWRATSGCSCYPHRDVGDRTNPCKNGCKYCFASPSKEQW